MSKHLKKYEQYGSPDDDESYYHEDDYLFGRPNYPKKKSVRDYDYEDDETMMDYDENIYDDDDNDGDGDDMQHLLYLLRMMFKNSGIDVDIRNNGLDVEIDAYLRHKERLKDVIKVFEIAKKIKKDILGQYDSEFDLFYTTKGQEPVLSFIFTYGDGLDDDNEPF